MTHRLFLLAREETGTAAKTRPIKAWAVPVPECLFVCLAMCGSHVFKSRPVHHFLFLIILQLHFLKEIKRIELALEYDRVSN